MINSYTPKFELGAQKTAPLMTMISLMGEKKSKLMSKGGGVACLWMVSRVSAGNDTGGSGNAQCPTARN